MILFVLPNKSVPLCFSLSPGKVFDTVRKAADQLAPGLRHFCSRGNQNHDSVSVSTKFQILFSPKYRAEELNSFQIK